MCWIIFSNLLRVISRVKWKADLGQPGNTVTEGGAGKDMKYTVFFFHHRKARQEMKAVQKMLDNFQQCTLG